MATKEELDAYLKSIGLKKDRWGHYKKIMKNGDVIRYKLQPLSLRIESKTKNGRWVRVGGDYYCWIMIVERKGKKQMIRNPKSPRMR